MVICTQRPFKKESTDNKEEKLEISNLFIHTNIIRRNNLGRGIEKKVAAIEVELFKINWTCADSKIQLRALNI